MPEAVYANLNSHAHINDDDTIKLTAVFYIDDISYLLQESHDMA